MFDFTLTNTLPAAGASLNMSLVAEEASTGRTLRDESVDTRGNTDKSWSGDPRTLLNERTFRGG